MSIKENFLAYLIGNERYSLFFRDYFEKQLLHISRNDPTFFGDIKEGIFSYLEQETLRYPDIRLVDNGGHIRKELFTTSSTYNNQFSFSDLIDHKAVKSLFQEGASLVATHVQRYNPKLKKYVDDLNAIFRGESYMNLYVTPKGGQGYRKHFDKDDVLVLQLAGSKRWYIFNTVGTKVAENKNYKSLIDECIDVPVQEIILMPGDVLYLPKGYFHDVKNEGSETSIHLSIGLQVLTWKLALQAYIQLLEGDVLYRSFVSEKESFKDEEQEVEKFFTNRVFLTFLRKYTSKQNKDQNLGTFFKNH